MEVSVVRRRWIAIGSALLCVVVLVSLVGGAWTLSGTRFRAGQQITFEIQDTTTWFWGCCCNCCEETLVLGWRIVDASELTLHSVALQQPAYASMWQGTWNQIDANGVAVSAGQYKLYVDTSAGTLSRCFTVYDPCSCTSWCSACNCTVCEDVDCITDCACKVSLVFVDNCSPCIFPFFWWGCCGSSTDCGCP
jgi:hypothetical protein